MAAGMKGYDVLLEAYFKTAVCRNQTTEYKSKNEVVFL